MADRYPRWAAEQAGTHDGPTVAQVLVLFVIVAAVLLALFGGPVATADSGDRPTRSTKPPPCARHFPPTCEDEARDR